MICGELSPRLGSAAQLVRQGATFADIGTDHAYLPIFLLKEGRIARAFCSDINEGPLATAKKNAEAAGVSERITFTLADGAEALLGRGITDYAICGMGGELIADIISAAPHLKDESIILILQPMSRHAHLRRYLASEGFSILAESYSRDSGKNYVCFLARYENSSRDISAAEAEFGGEDCEIVNLGAQIAYLEERKRSFMRIADGKTRGGESAPAELSLADEADRRIENIKKLIHP